MTYLATTNTCIHSAATADQVLASFDTSFTVNLSRTAGILSQAIAGRDAVALIEILHAGNKNSRKAFADVTGTDELPKGVNATKQAIYAFCGWDATRVEDQNQKRAKQIEAINHRRIAEQAASHRVNGTDGKQWIDNLIAQGHTRFIKVRVGKSNQYYLVNAKNVGCRMTGDLRAYAEVAAPVFEDRSQ